MLAGALLFVFGITTSLLAADSPRVTSDTVLRATASWDGVRYERYPSGQPELTVLKITIPPHTELSWHQHVMPSVAYVLSGEITVQMASDGRTRHAITGDALPEVVGESHRGCTGDHPAVLIVFYAGTLGVPLSHTPSRRATPPHRGGCLM